MHSLIYKNVVFLCFNIIILGKGNVSMYYLKDSNVLFYVNECQKITLLFSPELLVVGVGKTKPRGVSCFYL